MADLDMFIFWILAAHFIGDYVLQTPYIADKKGSDYWLLYGHSILYALPFALLGIGYNLLGVICISHLLIDWGKANRRWFGISIDQGLHLVVLAVVVAAVRLHWQLS